MSKKLFSNGAIYLVSNILNAAVPFMLLPILTRVLSPADYGLVSMFLMLITICGAFAGLSVHGAVSVNYFNMKKEELAEFVGSAMAILLVSTTALFVFLMYTDKVWEKSLLPKDWISIVCITAACQFVVNIRLVFWQVRKQAIRYGIFRISMTLANALLSIFLVLSINESWEGRALGVFLSTGLFALIAIALLFSNSDLSFNLRRKHISDAIKFGVPLIPHALGAFAIAMIDRLIVANKLGEEQVGIYMVALQVALVLAIVADAFVKAYAPWLYEKLANDSKQDRKSVVAATYLVFLAFIIILVPAIILAKLLFPFVIGPEFLEASDLVFWFLIGNTFIGMYYAVAGFFFYHKFTGTLSIITFASGCIAFVTTLILVDLYGIKGGAISFALSNLCMFTMTFIIAVRKFDLPWGEPKSLLDLLSKLRVKQHES